MSRESKNVMHRTGAYWSGDNYVSETCVGILKLDDLNDREAGLVEALGHAGASMINEIGTATSHGAMWSGGRVASALLLASLKEAGFLTEDYDPAVVEGIMREKSAFVAEQAAAVVVAQAPEYVEYEY